MTSMAQLPNPVLSTNLTVERIRNTSVQEYAKDYMNALKPVVITDAIDNWDALKKWSPEYFKNTYPNKKVLTNRWTGPEYLLKDYIDEVTQATESNPAPYLSTVNIPQHFPELLPDIQPHMPYALPDRMSSKLLPKDWPWENGLTEFFIGGPGNFTELHIDPNYIHAYIMQIFGEKEFIVFPPEQTPSLYQNQSGYSLVSQIKDPNNVDMNKFPLFAKTTPFKVTLKAGETIFLPAGWWHAVKNNTISISVGTNNVAHANWADFCKDIFKNDENTSTKDRIKNTIKYAYARGIVGPVHTAIEKAAGLI